MTRYTDRTGDTWDMDDMFRSRLEIRLYEDLCEGFEIAKEFKAEADRLTLANNQLYADLCKLTAERDTLKQLVPRERLTQ